MDKEKVQQIFQLLDGVPKQEWDILKHQVDRLYELSALAVPLRVTDKALEYMGDETQKLMEILDEDRLDSQRQEVHEVRGGEGMDEKPIEVHIEAEASREDLPELVKKVADMQKECSCNCTLSVKLTY